MSTSIWIRAISHYEQRIYTVDQNDQLEIDLPKEHKHQDHKQSTIEIETNNEVAELLSHINQSDTKIEVY